MGDTSSGSDSQASADGRTRPASGLFEQLYAELRHLAAHYLGGERAGHTLQPTALVHEAYLRLSAADIVGADAARFRALAARVMRHVLVDHAAARAADKRGGGRTLMSLTPDGPATPAVELDVQALDEALNRLAAMDERKARVVELRFFGGLTAEEAARELDVSLSTIEADWRMAKAWLRAELKRE